MEYRELGQSGLRVSRLCFGSLTMGPLQKNLSLEEGARLLRRALEGGVNFIDTAELYQNYSYLARALKGWSGDVVIATKTYAYSRQQAEASLEKARRALNREVVEIMLLHEQESPLTLKGHREALDYLQEAKDKGLIRALGFSTHHVAAVKAAVEMEGIDVIHPLVNMRGWGIRDGKLEDMLEAIAAARSRGIGIYAMKSLAGGHLINRAAEALAFVKNLAAVDAVAVGMGSLAELEYNLAFFSDRPVPHGVGGLGKQVRKLHFLPEEGCQGCRQCLQACPQEALEWREGRPAVREEECILCGYCGAHCPNLCWRIF